MKCIVNGKILLPDGELAGRTLIFDGGVITGIGDKPVPGAEVIDAKDGYVSPGLIDVHIHGFMGWDASNGRVSELQLMSRQMAR